MRVVALILVSIFLLLLPGCRCGHDLLFELFQDHYTGGGSDVESKRAHYESQLDAWNRYEPYGESRH